MADQNLETGRLIAANKVEGTAVYSRQGDKLGSIHNLMIDKSSGQVEYAVMSFGGFLGIGEDFHPLPWEKLDYSTEHGGYVVDVTEEQLKQAPKYGRNEQPAFDDNYGREVNDYYGASYAR